MVYAQMITCTVPANTEPIQFCSKDEYVGRILKAAFGEKTALERDECHDIDPNPNDFLCSECGSRTFIQVDNVNTSILSDRITLVERFNYCPICGRKVV